MLCFSNPGEIEIALVTTLGTHVKENSNPIGFFGTGLKYAIAGVLRRGGHVIIHSSETVYEFSTATQTLRGKEFHLVAMNGTPLGFTTELGKAWEPWMLYRELYSNAKDEGGEVALVDEVGEPVAGETRIYVIGLDDIYYQHSQIFLPNKPLRLGKRLEVHAGSSGHLFYRGVRVASLQQPSRYTYNLVSPRTLTEDRTLADSYIAKRDIAAYWAEDCQDLNELRDVISIDGDSFEGTLDFNWGSIAPSDLFKQVCGEMYKSDPGRLNQTAQLKVYQEIRESWQPEACQLTRIQELTLSRAVDFVSWLGHKPEAEIVVVKTLGPGLHGLARDGKIYIALETFQRGTKYVAHAVLEEWLHLHLGYDDMTRELQTWLFERVISLGEEMKGEPL